MSCPGLHCPGCTGKQSLGVLVGVVAVAYVADEVCIWVAERIWWIGGTVAVCFALATAASMWLEAWAERRGARFAAAHGILSRADVILPEAAPVITTVIPQVPWPEQPAIEHHYHGPQFHFHGPDAEAQAARVIRSVLPGRAGDAITSEGR